MDECGRGKLDPKKVMDFLEKKSCTVVIVTTEENDELRMSIYQEIRTEDHVLPWHFIILIPFPFLDMPR